jgi:hypothetical protein
MMSDLDRQIDELYQLPLSDFTSARNALAKTLAGQPSRDVKALAKPTAVPWAVNQVFWQARAVYDRVMKYGQAVRVAQVAMLEGKAADLRSATDAHRRAIGDAVSRAKELAAATDTNPDPDEIARMLEAVSLAQAPPVHAGRFTAVIGLSGFEALAGVTPVERPHEPVRPAKPSAEQQREQRAAQGKLRNATRRLEKAREREYAAREVLEEAKAEVAAAERALAGLEQTN